MKADLIRVGNAHFVSIPRAVIEHCGFGQRVEMRLEGDSLIITPGKVARSGWAEAFKAMAERGDDAEHFPDDLEHGFDETEWGWC